MFKTKKFIVFFAAALMLTAGCQIFDSKKAAEPQKDAKTAAVKKDAKAKKAAAPKKDVKTATVKKTAKPKKATKATKVKKVAKVKKKSKPSLAPARNQPTNYNKDKNKDNKESMVGFGFCAPLQFPSEDCTISAFRFSAFYTYNEAANGLDCGFICDSGTGGTKGIQAGIFVNRTAGPMTGLSLSLINLAATEMTGIQIGGIYNEAGSDSQDNAGANYETSYGVQVGAANVANSIFKGLQLGAFNISNAVFKGWQIGVLNLYEPPSDVFDDFQTPEFNKEKKKRSCIQVGVFNFNPNGMFPITILVNW